MHTPGPWTYSQRERAPWKFEIHTPTTGGPSMPTEYRREIALTTDGNEANARLIATTPALLATLQELLGVTELNLDDMEPETRVIVQKAVELVTPFEGG